ncbi:hypothetical protein [Lentzea sp. NPDC003310]|uniref:hypothetical protein n=1 Tax=Lentzea sp. NPDC003310 TaxID=3154447 RepID=UPI0033BBC438
MSDWDGIYRIIGTSGTGTWDEVGTTWRGRYAGARAYRSSIQIVDSVLASGIAGQLLVATAMDDLAVAPAAPKAGRDGTITVISPVSYPVVPEHMGLAFCTSSGRRREFRQHPIEDAVTGFWRMVEEKFGLTR